jgi:hypothetical protein
LLPVRHQKMESILCDELRNLQWLSSIRSFSDLW